MDEGDLFKKEFKYYKRRNPPPNFCNVIDFYSEKNNNCSDYFEKFNVHLKSENDSCGLCENCGLKNHLTWEINKSKSLTGFMYIKNPFTPKGQRLWIRKCLELYPRKPSLTNLDLHYENVDNIWSLRNDEDLDKRSYLRKLCWATFGYHHDWETKIYNPSQCTEFPKCLKELSQHVASLVGYQEFQPEAAIVNYYNMKSSLGIHNDHSEENINAPIISFSFGQTGIFLIGTESKCEKPHAIFLRSGDIIIMSGSCRLSYHAVPCIIEEKLSNLFSDVEKDGMWEPFEEYISSARINISVRQVY